MADGFQFFREQGYAIVRGQGAPSTGKGKKALGNRGEGKRSARDIVGEAIRADGDHPHVKNPQPPRVLHGLPADKLMSWVTELEEQARKQVVEAVSKLGKKHERRQRSDTPVLIGAVASYPGPADDSDSDYVRWCEKTVAFFKRRYGDKIVAIIQHSDEPHGHVHCLAADAGRSVKPLMAGHAAQLAAEAAGKTKKECSAAYKQGGRDVQDQFFADVGIECGLTRLGPGVQSLPKPAWQAQKAQARAIAEALKKKEEAEAELASQRSAIKSAALSLQKKDQDLQAERRHINHLLEAMSPEEASAAGYKLKKIEKRDAAAEAVKNSPASPPTAKPKIGPRTP